MEKLRSARHGGFAFLVLVLCMLPASCAENSALPPVAGASSAGQAASTPLKLTEAQQSWVDDILHCAGMSGEEHADPYPISARQALMAAALQHAEDRKYQSEPAGSNVTVTLRCSESGRWELTWTGRHSALWYGKPAGWCYGLYIDATSGNVAEQPNADFEWVEETEAPASPPPDEATD